MTTMLINAPLTDQLAAYLPDGQPDPNRQADCVPASLASGITAITDKSMTTGDLKTLVYGANYTGGTDPYRYMEWLNAHPAYGVRLIEQTSQDGAQLVSLIRAGLREGHPMSGAIPSMWGTTTAAQIAASGGPTHEVLWCDDSAGQLTAMNPWHGFYHTNTDAWWASRIVYGRVFVMEQAETSGASFQIGAGIAAYIAAHPEYGQPIANEVYVGTAMAGVPMSSGATLVWDNVGHMVRADWGAKYWMARLAEAEAKAAAPAPAPTTMPVNPLLTAADAAMRAWIVAVHEYALAGVKND